MSDFQGITDSVKLRSNLVDSSLLSISNAANEQVEQKTVPEQQTTETEATEATQTTENENETKQEVQETSSEEEKNAAGQEQVQEDEAKQVEEKEAKPEEKPETNEETKEEDWYSLTSEVESGTTDTPQPNIDFEKLSTDLGIEVKSEADIVAGYKKLQENPIEGIQNIPKSLQEAIGLSQNGGDWQTFLGISQVNYDNFSNHDLVYHEYSHNPYFHNEKGELDAEKLKDHLEAMPEADINIRGNELRNNLKTQQSNDIKNIQRKADIQKQKNDKALKAVIDQKDYHINNWKPKARDKAKAWNNITSGNWKKAFENEDGSPNFDNIYKAHLFLTNQKDIIDNVTKNASTQAKKEIYSTEQNVEINKNSSPPVATPKKELGGYDLLVADSKKRSSF